MNINDFKKANPNLGGVILDALEAAMHQIGGIEAMRKLDWFCSRADEHIARELKKSA